MTKHIWQCLSLLHKISHSTQSFNGNTQPLTRLLKKTRRQSYQQANKTLQQELPDLQNSNPLLNFNLMWSTKYLVLNAHGVMWVRLEDALKLERKNVRNVKSYAGGSNIAKQAWSWHHSIADFENSQVIDKGSFRVRKTL